MERQKILNISNVKYTGFVYNIELKSNSNNDDLFWVEQDSKIVSHNCFPKDLNALIYLARENQFRPYLLEEVWRKNCSVRKNKDWLK